MLTYIYKNMDKKMEKGLIYFKISACIVETCQSAYTYIQICGSIALYREMP